MLQVTRPSGISCRLESEATTRLMEPLSETDTRRLRREISKLLRFDKFDFWAGAICFTVLQGFAALWFSNPYTFGLQLGTWLWGDSRLLSFSALSIVTSRTVKFHFYMDCCSFIINQEVHHGLNDLNALVPFSN